MKTSFHQYLKFKKMSQKLKHVILLVLVMSAFAANAQNSKVESVRMIIESTDPNEVKDLRECKRLIDDAKEHPKTANSPKMWVYRAAVYYEISRKFDDLNKETPGAIEIAADALFKCHETDIKKAWTEPFDLYLLNVAYVMFNTAITKYYNKSYDTAINYYQTTLKLIPLDTKGELSRNNINEDAIYQYSYYAAMANGDNKRTKEFISKLIERNFNDPKIYTALAKVYLDDIDTTNAVKTLATGRQRFPNDMDLMNMELDIFLKLGKTDILLKKLEDAIAADDQNKIYFFARAATYEKLNMFDLAEKDYQKALELDPDYYDANFNMGVLSVNKAKPVIEELIKTHVKAEQDKLDVKINDIYKIALKYFEKCLEIGVPGDNKKEKFELVQTMQRLYKQVGNTAKEAEMKALNE